MKRTGLTCLLICLALLFLAGCGREAQISAAQYLPAEAQTVTITHDACGIEKTTQAEGGDLQALRGWLAALKLGKRAEFADGQFPGQNEDGGEIYWFAYGDGEPLSYRNFGPDACYFVVGGEWYPVANPTAPPAGE